MLKRLFPIVLINIMLVGCMAKRQVTEENLFLSSMPPLSIKVLPQMPYIGMTKSSRFNSGVGEDRFKSAPERYEVYYFSEASRTSAIKRMAIIVVSGLVESNWRYEDTFEKWWTAPLQLGKIDFGGYTYNSAYLLGSLDDTDFEKYFNSKEHFLTECYALSVLHRISGETNNVMLWYGEDCQGFNQRLGNRNMNDPQNRAAIVKAIEASFEEAIACQN